MDVIPSPKELIHQIGLNFYYPGTPRSDLHVENLPYFAENNSTSCHRKKPLLSTPLLREERLQKRLRPATVVEACASNNLPYIILEWAAKGQLDQVNEPVSFMQELATPLMWACLNGHLGVVRFLLDHGADPSVVCGTENSTALHWAIAGGNADIVRLLLDDERTDPNKENVMGCDAAATAIAHGNLLLLWMVCEDEHIENEKRRESQDSEQHPLPRRNYYRMMPEKTTAAGHTLLHYAAWRNCVAACEYLVERWHFNLNPVDQQGRTPLIWASREGHTEVVEYLLRAGADPFHQDNDGMTALRYAITRSQREAARALSSMLGASSRFAPNAGASPSGRVVPISSNYQPCRSVRGLGTLASILRVHEFRVCMVNGFLFFVFFAALNMVTPVVFSYLAAGLYIFRNYAWLLLYGVPIHLDGAGRPDAMTASGRTLYCSTRGTWVTRYRDPGNLVLFLCVIAMQCVAWNKLGMPGLFTAPASGDSLFAEAGGKPISPNSLAEAARPSAFFGGFFLQLFWFSNARQMISRTLEICLCGVLTLIFLCKLRSHTDVIPRSREVHWTRSPIWRMLRSREFKFYHPRTLAVNRHLQIPLRAFYCGELDAYIERYDSYASSIDAPISRSNKVLWTLLLSLLVVTELLFLVWGAQLLQSALHCTHEDQQWFSRQGFRLLFQQGAPPTPGVPTPAASSSTSTRGNGSDLTTTGLSTVNLILNVWIHGLPCRQTSYAATVAATYPSLISRLVHWFFFPSWASYYGLWVQQISLVIVVWAGMLAIRQWKSLWYGASTTEMANPLAPREDGRLVSIFVPRKTPRASIVLDSYDEEEEGYYAAVAPHTVRKFPPVGADHCIYASTSGIANILLSLLGRDGRKWANAKLVSLSNAPVTSSLLAETPLPSWEGLLQGTTAPGSPSCDAAAQESLFSV